MNRKFLSAVTIFFGSMLLFGVQPMVGRTLLPFFGGTSAVWIVCLCAFQVLLLGGYFYAHRLSQGNLSHRLKVHLAVLAVTAVWAFSVAGLRDNLGSMVSGLPPALGVMTFLILIVGAPYVALSANSSLVQSLASDGDADVYHLYAVSNNGSLVGLFLYPFVLEPFVTIATQWRMFGVGLAVYAVLLLALGKCRPRSSVPNKHIDWRSHREAAARVVRDAASPLASHPSSPNPHPSFLWLLLPAVSCVVLNAVTAHLTLDVIALPLLWCLLLALFLLSYVIGFSSFGSRMLPLWDALAILSLGLLAYAAGLLAGSGAYRWELPGGCGLVLFGGSALHVRLYRSRPGADELTRYYLFGAIGGAIGGVLTGLVAPLVFPKVYEYPCAIAIFALALVTLREWKAWKRQVPLATLALLAMAGFFFRFCNKLNPGEEDILTDRGFYGTVRVGSVKAKVGDRIGALHSYTHGATLHCEQLMIPGMEPRPALYYTPHGGGFAIVGHPKYRQGRPMRVGIVGMGMGVSCAYGRTNDVYRCWEISPEALNVATNPAYFTYVSDCKAKVETVLGDARLALEQERRENAPKYDVLQIDAFSGDSVPYHLSTKEAFQLYLDRLAPGGFLSVHISNWHINFAPLIKAVAYEFYANAILYTPDPSTGETFSGWALLVKEPPKDFTIPSGVNLVDLNNVRDWKLPTDEKGSLVDLLYCERSEK